MDMTFVAQSLVNGVLMGGVYGLVAIGLTLVFGVLKIINFAHGAFMMLGMYFTYYMVSHLHIDPYLSIIAVLPMLFIIGVVTERLLIARVLDAPENNQLFLTLGIMLFLQNMAIFLWTPDFRVMHNTYGDVNYFIGDVSISLPHLLAFGITILFAMFIFVLLTKTDIGRAIRAASEDKVGSTLMGINVKKIYWVTFGLGTACAGVAGTAVTPFFPIYPYVGDIFLLTAYVVVVLGGLGSVVGALVGGIVIGVADSVGAMLLPGSMKQVISFLLFILVLLVKPTGMFGRKNA
jgi:branched-chain amino acid transport system permease protein